LTWGATREDVDWDCGTVWCEHYRRVELYDELSEKLAPWLVC